MGSAFDGSQGVDSQDIANIPQVGFTSFQLFPDTDNYAPTGSGQNVAPVNETGIQWIQTQAQTSATYVPSTTPRIVLICPPLIDMGNRPFSTVSVL